MNQQTSTPPHPPQYEPFLPAAYKLAATYQLGTPQEEFRVGHQTRYIVAGVILLCFGLFFASIEWSMHVKRNIPLNVLLPIILLLIKREPFLSILVLILFLTAFYCLFYPLFYRSWHIYLCSYGFVYLHGKKVHALRWDQIADAHGKAVQHHLYGAYLRTSHRYTIRSRDGKKIVLNDKFTDVERLGDHIIREFKQAGRL